MNFYDYDCQWNSIYLRILNNLFIYGSPININFTIGKTWNLSKFL